MHAAFAHNPQVRAALSRLDASQAERVQAGLISNPMLSLMALRPEGGGRFQLEYGLMQSLYDLLTRSRRVQLADAEARRSEAEVLLQLGTLAQDTRAAVVDAWFADQSLRLERQWLLVEEEAHQLAQRQAEQGVVSVSAVWSQESAVASRARSAAAAEAELADARALLAGLLGLESAEAILLPTEMSIPVLPVLDTAELQAWARQHRAELQLATAQAAQARAQRDLDVGPLRALQPSIGVAGMREADDMALQGPAVQITLPLFDTGEARRLAADARLEEAEHQIESTKRQISLEVESALARTSSAQEAFARAQLQVRKQQQLLALARRSYQQGIGSRTDYLQALRGQLTAMQDELQSRRALWNELFAIERAVGRALQGRDGLPRSSTAE
jgi:outer membrane protein TolC